MLKYARALPSCARLRVGRCRGWMTRQRGLERVRPAVWERCDGDGGRGMLPAGSVGPLAGGSWAPAGTVRAIPHCRGKGRGRPRGNRRRVRQLHIRGSPCASGAPARDAARGSAAAHLEHRPRTNQHQRHVVAVFVFALQRCAGVEVEDAKAPAGAHQGLVDLVGVVLEVPRDVRPR